MTTNHTRPSRTAAFTDFNQLTVGRRIRFTDHGFGDLLSHPRSGQEAAVHVAYRRDEGLVIRFDDGALTWCHPTEVELIEE